MTRRTQRAAGAPVQPAPNSERTSQPRYSAVAYLMTLLTVMILLIIISYFIQQRNNRSHDNSNESLNMLEIEAPQYKDQIPVYGTCISNKANFHGMNLYCMEDRKI